MRKGAFRYTERPPPSILLNKLSTFDAAIFRPVSWRRSPTEIIFHGNPKEEWRDPCQAPLAIFTTKFNGVSPLQGMEPTIKEGTTVTTAVCLLHGEISRFERSGRHDGMKLRGLE